MSQKRYFKQFHVVVDAIPRWAMLCWPLYRFCTSIIILDNSLISASSKEMLIEFFIGKLHRLGLTHKIVAHDLYSFDKLRWKANSLSVRFLEYKYKSERASSGEMRYFSGYLAHRQTEHISRVVYFRKIRRQLKTDLNGAIFFQTQEFLFSRLVKSRLIATFVGLMVTTITPALLFYIFVRCCNWTMSAKKEDYDGISVDHSFGIKLQSSGEVDRTQYHDGIIVEDNTASPFYSVALFGFGWPLNGDKLQIEQKSKGRFRTFGVSGRRVKVSFKVFLELYLKHVWLAIRLVFFSSVERSCHKNWLVLAYCKDRFLASLSFAEFRPKVYLSRLDYSYRHHALGAACKEYGVHYAGICHSALGGSGYVPQRSIISFDTFFVYSEWFSKFFFPTWSNAFTHLVTMGVWRSDLTYHCRARKSTHEKAQRIRQKVDGRWLVALHLPVPQSYLFNKKSVTKWMSGFANLVSANSGVFFVLFPRRLSQAPDYFHNQLERLITQENCCLAEDLESGWSQSYPWLLVTDMVIGCFYSDATAEALAAGVPAIIYTNTGKGVSMIEQFDRTLVAYNTDEIEEAIDRAQFQNWPSDELRRRIDEKWLGVADGKCLSRIRGSLRKYLPSEIIK